VALRDRPAVQINQALGYDSAVVACKQGSLTAPQLQSDIRVAELEQASRKLFRASVADGAGLIGEQLAIARVLAREYHPSAGSDRLKQYNPEALPVAGWEARDIRTPEQADLLPLADAAVKGDGTYKAVASYAAL
jgi:hypothetical protein